MGNRSGNTGSLGCLPGSSSAAVCDRPGCLIDRAKYTCPARLPLWSQTKSRGGIVFTQRQLVSYDKAKTLPGSPLECLSAALLPCDRSGRRLYSAIPLAVTSAGIPLHTQADLAQGKALSADFTAEGWRTQLGFAEIPLLGPSQAGIILARLAQELDFAMFEYWLSDYAGHGQNMEQACMLLETFDQVLGGLLNTWDDAHGLILITSDHGNLEDLSTRHHTRNPVPALIIGNPEDRQLFTENLHDLTGISPAILRYLKLGEQ